MRERYAPLLMVQATDAAMVSPNWTASALADFGRHAESARRATLDLFFDGRSRLNIQDNVLSQPVSRAQSQICIET